MNELLKRACEEPTLIKALSVACMWECERAIKQAHKNLTNNTPDVDGKMWDMCFEFIIKQVMDNYKGEKMATEKIDKSDPIKRMRAMLEAEHDAKLIGFNELDDDLKNWLFRILRRKNAHEILLIFKNSAERIEIVMFTETYEYSIIANERHNYLGGGYKLRKNQAGEHWQRGGDLPDGKYNRDTCDEIIKAIISNELVPLQLQI